MTKSYKVFSIHDPRAEEALSAVYVGLTQQADPEPHFATIFKKKLPDLSSAMLREKRQAVVSVEADNLTQDDALRLRESLVVKYRAAGCSIIHRHRKGAAKPFRVVWAMPAAPSGQ